jgi:AcrR family transcriptional regulator
MNVVFSGSVRGQSTLNAAFSQMAVRKRTYEQSERARTTGETRRRIVEATVALHEEVGPARTTVAEIARRAGVQRLTVYTHFPEDRDLFAACSQHFIGQHLPPDPGPWTEIADPGARLRRALRDLHAWYESGEAMFANVERDRAALPALAAVVDEGRGAFLGATREILAAGLPAGRRLDAAIGLATSFGAWQHLARVEGLGAKDAVEILARSVEAAALK